MFYVFSTLTCDTNYCIYGNQTNRDVAIAKKKILIHGGHGVANKHVYTPMGVMTEVSEEDMKLLEADVHFQNHVKDGFIKVEKKKADTAKVAADMEQKDGSAPLTPQDYEEGDRAEAKSYKVKKGKGMTL